jgi:hypothetical protein
MKRDEILRERRRLKAKYGEFFDALAALLFRHDPIGINFETNTDEYEPEEGTILPRLHACHSEGDAVRVVHEEFIRWFSAEDAGPVARYVQLGKEIWQLWQQQGANGRKRPEPQ